MKTLIVAPVRRSTRRSDLNNPLKDITPHYPQGKTLACRFVVPLFIGMMDACGVLQAQPLLSAQPLQVHAPLRTPMPTLSGPSIKRDDPLSEEHLSLASGTTARIEVPVPALRPYYILQVTPEDQTLSITMRRFLSEHGWALSWEIEHDFPVRYAAEFRGDVLQIVEQIADALQSVDTPIRVKAYSGNKVLRVLYATN